MATLAVFGETETVTEAGGGVVLAPVIVTVAEAEAPDLACETAVTVTLAGLGTFVGAV